MALYGEARDISFMRHINRELMANIVSQQCAFYKFNAQKTNVNMYGEAAHEKFYTGPVLLYCLIDIPESQNPVDDFGVSFAWNPTFRFLRDDLLNKFQGYDGQTDTFNETNYDTTDYNYNIFGANYVPQIGDIIYYEDSYYEVDRSWNTQYFVGKNPDYPNNPQPTPGWNPGLQNFGWNVEIACQTHYVPADKVAITLERM